MDIKLYVWEESVRMSITWWSHWHYQPPSVASGQMMVVDPNLVGKNQCRYDVKTISEVKKSTINELLSSASGPGGVVNFRTASCWYGCYNYGRFISFYMEYFKCWRRWNVGSLKCGTIPNDNLRSRFSTQLVWKRCWFIGWSPVSSNVFCVFEAMFPSFNRPQTWMFPWPSWWKREERTGAAPASWVDREWDLVTESQDTNTQDKPLSQKNMTSVQFLQKL